MKNTQISKVRQPDEASTMDADRSRSRVHQNCQSTSALARIEEAQVAADMMPSHIRHVDVIGLGKSGQPSGRYLTLLTQTTDRDDWQLAIIADGARIEGSTGTACRYRARAITNALRVDALAGAHAPKTQAPATDVTSSHRRVLAIMAACNLAAAGSESGILSSGMEAEDRQQEGRIPSS